METSLDHLITVDQAIAILDATGVVSTREQISLADAAGRVLAEDVTADREYPPFDKALMDGYAVHAADTAGGTLRRVGEIAAGGHADRSLASGECVAIMTGAPLPAGADAVVPIEQTTLDGDTVHVAKPVKSGNAVQWRGTEMTPGHELLKAGTVLTPMALAVCATVGASEPIVYGRPRVGVLCSGDEVIAADQTPEGAQIRNSNTPMLMALIQRFGVDAIDLGHVKDDPAAIAEKLSAPGLDALLVTGGMSMGEYDYTPRVLRDLGYDMAITKLKMKPGKPFVFARIGTGDWGPGTSEKTASPAILHQSPVPGPLSLPPFVFGLPGNPVSAFVCTVRLVSRLLLRMAGASPEPEWVTAELAEALPANGPREFYQPAVVEKGVARVLGWRGSADVFTLARANALLVRMPDEAKLAAGDKVSLLRLP